MANPEIVTTSSPFINGALVTGAGPALDVRSPATGELVGSVETASLTQFGDAIDAARQAFDRGPWPRLPRAERIAAVLRIGDALTARRDLLVDTVIAETGCPRLVTETAQVDLALASVREMVDLAAALPEWEHNRAPLGDHLVGSTVRLSISRYEAAGVVAAITPYNFPLITNVWKVVPALLAGCTIILRPSPLTPLEALLFGDIALEAGLPPGVLNVVAEAGNDGGALLSSHPDVDLVSFTGSGAVGRLIAAQAAPTLKRVVMELGGKSVQLHLPDVLGDLAGVTAATMGVFVAHAGQGCALQTRLLVPNDRKAEVVSAVSAAAATLTIGDPQAATTMVGPLISEVQRNRVHDLVTRAIDSGAKLVTGGQVPPGLDRGWFYEPTVLDVEDPTNPIAQEEAFGPVVAVLGYDSIDEAVEIANGTEYGLSGAVYTGDLAQGVAIAERIRSGTIQVNTGWASGYTPMGGVKQSGYGRERGVAGLREFQELKHIVVGSR